MTEMKSISFEICELPALKKLILGGERDYSDRVSFGLCMQLLHLRETRNEDGEVMFEMGALEGMGPCTRM